MDFTLPPPCRYSFSYARDLCPCGLGSCTNKCSGTLVTPWDTGIFARKLAKDHRYQPQRKPRPDLGDNNLLKKPNARTNRTFTPYFSVENNIDFDPEGENIADGIWDAEEVEAISSLFKGRISQTPGKLHRERPLPLPKHNKLLRLGLPTPKKRTKSVGATRRSVSGQVYKNPEFLVGLARDIRKLPAKEDVSLLLNRWARFLRRGSLSLTIRELGSVGLPDRSLQVFCWAQKQQHLFPDDRILASTVEVLARSHELKMPFDPERFVTLTSQGVHEAAIRGFIRGNLRLAWKLLSSARTAKKMLDTGLYARLIVEFGKNPDRYPLVLLLLEELAGKENPNLTQKDYIAIMKVCIRLEKFESVEELFHWFIQAGNEPSVVMYTTLIHSRYFEGKYREALAVVWEMEASDCLLDLPAYRMVIKLFLALDDLPRAVRYFSKLSNAGFLPTYDIFRNMIKMYMASGRVAKCKELCEEAEMAGFKLDKEIRSRLLQLET